MTSGSTGDERYRARFGVGLRPRLGHHTNRAEFATYFEGGLAKLGITVPKRSFPCQTKVRYLINCYSVSNT